MKTFLFIIIMIFSKSVIANWTCIPDDGTTYSEESNCPCACVPYDPTTNKADLDLIDGNAVENSGRKASREGAEQTAAAAELADLNRLRALRDKPTNYNAQDIQDILKALLLINVLGP